MLTPCCVGVLNREDGEEEDAGEVEEEGEEAASLPSLSSRLISCTCTPCKVLVPFEVLSDGGLFLTPLC